MGHCSRIFFVTVILQLKLAVLNIFQKIKAISVLQPILYRGNCFIQADSGQGFIICGELHLGVMQS